MSYASRLYRQRNPAVQDESKDKSFFSRKDSGQGGKKNRPFFQSKLQTNEPGDAHEKEADAVANRAVNKSGLTNISRKNEITGIQRLATTHEEEIESSNDNRMERDKEKPFQRKPSGIEKEKVPEMNAAPEKEKDKATQKKGMVPEKGKEKVLNKKEDPMKEKKEQKGISEHTKEKDKMLNKKEDVKKDDDKKMDQAGPSPEKETDKKG